MHDRGVEPSDVVRGMTEGSSLAMLSMVWPTRVKPNDVVSGMTKGLSLATLSTLVMLSVVRPTCVEPSDFVGSVTGSNCARWHCWRCDRGAQAWRCCQGKTWDVEGCLTTLRDSEGHEVIKGMARDVESLDPHWESSWWNPIRLDRIYTQSFLPCAQQSLFLPSAMIMRCYMSSRSWW